MTGFAAVTHHIGLDGAGYIVKRESYSQSNQAPVIQRVAIGQPDLTSIVNAQYARQDDFTGGEGMITFGDPDIDRFKQSYGFHPRDVEELRLLRAVEGPFGSTPNDCFFATFGGRLWRADKTTADLDYSTNGSTWSNFSFPTGYSGAIGGIAIVHNREMDERLLVMSVTGIFFGIKPDGTVDTDVGDVNGVRDYSGEFAAATWSHLLEWGHSIYFGHGEAVFRRSGMEGTEQIIIFSIPGWFYQWGSQNYLISAYGALMGNASFTPPVSYMDRLPARQGDVAAMAYALNPQMLCIGTYDAALEKSFITITNGTVEFPTDAGDAINFVPALELPDFEIRTMVGFQGQLLYAGQKTIAGRKVGQVYAYPRRLVADLGENLTDAFDYTVRAMGVEEAVFFGNSNNVQSNGEHAPGLMVLNSKGVFVGPQPDSYNASGSSQIVDAISTFKGQTYWAVRGKGIYRTSEAREFVEAARLETSRYDVNMKVVDKKWLDLDIRLGADLAGDQEIVVKYLVEGGTWQTLTTITSASGTTIVAAFPDALISTWLKLALEFTQSSNDTDIVVESLTLRTLIVSDGKLEWAFVLQAWDNMELEDSESIAGGTRSVESRTGLEIMAALRTAYRAREPIVFEDIDQVAYSVMVTNVKMAVPKIEHPTTDDLEYDVAVELVEV